MGKRIFKMSFVVVVLSGLALSSWPAAFTPGNLVLADCLKD